MKEKNRMHFDDFKREERQELDKARMALTCRPLFSMQNYRRLTPYYPSLPATVEELVTISVDSRIKELKSSTATELDKLRENQNKDATVRALDMALTWKSLTSPTSCVEPN